MKQLLFGTWGPYLSAYNDRHPWELFGIAALACLMIAALVMQEPSRHDRGVIGDFGAGDGGCDNATGGDGGDCGGD